ncbi:hypothetical protein GAO09_16985 [Rhizobiales bacterium RZME27]|uniref:Class I SAM-dependent methyltransferase n=1 Tax=Endobacterium cereale TaxID=2663029 RepID=A0A6A8A8Y5_9HYPH|nr:hypothetical protein [Endobacterium cereale]MEB2846845.1 hypothetical protein [Endobacterium cereale]MQY47733.1 hypothetical protein [Endobacterium cereale]
MILEALQYAATYPVTPKPFRPFIRSSVNLWARAGRCAKDWATHEAQCQTFVRETVSGMKERRTVVVLGSGLLRDVPLAFLSKTFDTVVLVDLVHLASVRLWLSAKRPRNVRLISRDLSGLDDVLAGRETEPLSFLRQVPYLDLVISANILSQIGVGATRRLETDKSGDATEVVPKLISAHINGLAGLPCTVALLTDTRYRVSERSGAVLEDTDLLCGITPPPAAQSWSWPVAPFGEESRDYQVVHDVIATSALSRFSV